MDPVLAGETILYQLTVTNTGPSAAVNVVITDSVPLSTTLVGISPLCVESDGVVSCQVGDLGSGAHTSVFIQVEVDADVPDGTTIDNTGFVSSDTDESETINNSEDEDTTVTQPSLGLVDLEILRQMKLIR